MIKGIIGLPGSGKTNVMNDYMLSKKFNCMIDDMGDGHDAWRKNIDLAKEKLSLGYDVIISDVGLCDKAKRDWLEGYFPMIEWEFFDNDKETCIENVTRRHKVEHSKYPLQQYIDTINTLSAVYNPINPKYRCFKHD